MNNCLIYVASYDNKDSIFFSHFFFFFRILVLNLVFYLLVRSLTRGISETIVLMPSLESFKDSRSCLLIFGKKSRKTPKAKSRCETDVRTMHIFSTSFESKTSRQAVRPLFLVNRTLARNFQ